VVREPHLLQSRLPALAERDAAFAAMVTRGVVEHAIAEVPDEFLVPLLGDSADAAAVRERRSAYAEFLSQRLEPPRPFLEIVLVQGSKRPVRGRPAWLERGR
jgi:hypothetical protein